MFIGDIETPALLLDLRKFEANCARMKALCHGRGVALRPHMKTLKSVDAARIAIDGRHGGIAVSTLREAEYFAHQGFSDIQLAVCLPPSKLDRAATLLEAAPDFSFFVDSLEAARAIISHGAPFGAWIEVDCGEHRTGVGEDRTLLAIADTLAGASQAQLIGVATHAGQAYSARSAEAIGRIAEEERLAVVRASQRLGVAGHRDLRVSAGSTPTAIHARSSDGLSEMRAGVFMAGDLFQANVGSVRQEDIAASVLTTVIHCDTSTGRVVVDAGGLALSKDRSTAETPERDWGYGLVVDVAGRPLGQLIVSGVHQEHGDIHRIPEHLLPQLAVGEVVRILPNHICMTAAMYNTMWVVDGLDVVGRWPRANGWESTAQ